MTAEATPEDQGGLVRHLFFFLGFVPLLSWNFFTMLTGYWMFKFRDPQTALNGSSPNATQTASLNDEVMNALQVDFTSYMVITCMIPTVAVPLINAIAGHRFKTSPRLLASLIVLILLLLFHVTMTVVNTDKWQKIFLLLVLITIFLLGTFTSVFISGFTGIAETVFELIFVRDYMIALLRGQALCAVFSAVANIIVLSLSSDDISVAFYCFALTVILHLAALFALIGITKNAFYKHHAAVPASTEVNNIAESVHTQEEERPLLGRATAPVNISLVSIALKIRVELVTIFLLYTITLACHPGLTVLVESTGLHSGSATAWERVYFVPVTCFLCFTVGNFLGRLAMPYLPLPSPTLALVLTCLRALALPLFLACNLVPAKRVFTSVLIPSDAAYIILMLFFSVSTGILTSVVMVAIKTRVRKEEQQAATNIMGGVRGLGLVLGSAISVLTVQFL